MKPMPQKQPTPAQRIRRMSQSFEKDYSILAEDYEFFTTPDSKPSWLRDEFKAHGHYRSEYTDRMRLHMGFKWRVCSLSTRAEILQLYLNINAGGTPHTQAELDRVRIMLAHEKGEL